MDLQDGRASASRAGVEGAPTTVGDLPARDGIWRQTDRSRWHDGCCVRRDRPEGLERSEPELSAFVSVKGVIEEAAVVCTECGREVDEFTTIAERWLYYSDGRDLYPFCPECAKREFAPDAAVSGRLPLARPPGEE
jgi:hypothetical protein